MIFAFLAGTNFILMYKFLYKENLKHLLKSEEFMTYLAIVVLLGLLIGFSLYKNMDFTPKNALLAGFFKQ